MADEFDPFKSGDATAVAEPEQAFDPFKSGTATEVAPTQPPQPAASLTGILGFARKPSPEWLQPFEKFVTAPLVSPEMAETALRATPIGAAVTQAEEILPKNLPTEIASGAIHGAAEVASGFSSPANVGLLALTPEGALGKAIAAGFTVEGLRQFPELYRQYQATDDPKEKAAIFAKGAALLLPAAGLLPRGGGLSEALFPSAKPVAAPILTPELSVETRVPEERIIPNATQEGIKPESYQPEYTGNGQVRPPAETGGRGVVEPSAQEPTQEVAGRADVMALAEQAAKPIEAAPAEEAPSAPQSITSIKNEQVDAERAARGLPAVVQPARKAFGESWDEAGKKIDENPSYPDQLIDELKTKPRALTDVEDATLLHRQVDLQNQYQKAADTLFKARDAGDDIAKLEANGRVNALSDQLLELYDVGKKAGTETGRGLAARKLLAAEDFSLANMITQKRAALQGEELTPEQVENVTKAKNKVSAAQIALDAYETSSKAEGYRKRLATLTEQYKARTEAGDFAPRQRTPIPLDKDLQQRQADLARAKKDWYTELAKDKAKNRTSSQKFWDRFVGVERAMKLSSDVVLAKLTTAAAVREGVLTPVEEAAGGMISKALPGLAKRAPREGGFSLGAEIKAKAEMFTTGMKDAWQNLKMKQTDLDELYKTGKIKAPDEFYDYLGYLHGALKAPVKRAEFTRSLTKRMRWEVENGGDLNNVNTMRNLSEQAYVDANRSIFLQDNIVSDLFTGGLRRSETYKKAPNLGPAAARIGRFLIPIVKVPTNIVGEVATGVHGVVTGGTRAATAYIKGIESLPTEQGDAIMRQLKKGLVGNALLLTGYLGYESIGGFYHDQDKRAEADVQPGRYRVGNVDIPASAGHSTGAMLLNIGATVHRVQDERIRKAESETKGVGEGLRAAGAGLAHEVPFVPAVTGIIDALDSKHGFEKYIMGMIGSTTTPALVTHLAKTIDTPGTFPSNILEPATPRKPTTPVEAFEATIPGLRERVPERKPKGSKKGDYVR